MTKAELHALNVQLDALRVQVANCADLAQARLLQAEADAVESRIWDYYEAQADEKCEYCDRRSCGC
jgi:hypothetical protein